MQVCQLMIRKLVTSNQIPCLSYSEIPNIGDYIVLVNDNFCKILDLIYLEKNQIILFKIYNFNICRIQRNIQIKHMNYFFKFINFFFS